MGKIVIHDGVTSREFHVANLNDTIHVHVNEKQVEVPDGYELVREVATPRV